MDDIKKAGENVAEKRSRVLTALISTITELRIYQQVLLDCHYKEMFDTQGDALRIGKVAEDIDGLRLHIIMETGPEEPALGGDCPKCTEGHFVETTMMGGPGKFTCGNCGFTKGENR